MASLGRALILSVIFSCMAAMSISMFEGMKFLGWCWILLDCRAESSKAVGKHRRQTDRQIDTAAETDRQRDKKTPKTKTGLGLNK